MFRITARLVAVPVKAGFVIVEVIQDLVLNLADS